MITIGCCHGPGDVDSRFLDCFDYREVSLSTFEERFPAEDLEAFAATLDPPARFVMGVFPRGTRLYDSRAHVDDALARIAFVGRILARTGVAGLSFGAGAVRTYPRNTDARRCERILAELLGALASACAAVGARLLIENLPRAESGIFNTVSDVFRFLDAHPLPATSALYDVRAGAMEGDGPDFALEHLDRIGHIHVPFPDAPFRGTPYDTDRVVQGLLDAGYAGTVSIEPIGVAISADVVAMRARLASTR